MRTDSESYLISVYRCPTRLPRREGQKETEEQEEEGEEEEEEEQQEQQVLGEEGQPFFPPGGYGAPPGMFGGPGLRRKKLSFKPKEKRKVERRLLAMVGLLLGCQLVS